MQSIGACTSHTFKMHIRIIKMSWKWRRQSTTSQYYAVDGRKHKQFAFIIRLTILRIRTIGFRFVLLVFSLFVLKVRIYHLQWQVRLIWLLTTIVLVLWLFFVVVAVIFISRNLLRSDGFSLLLSSLQISLHLAIVSFYVNVIVLLACLLRGVSFFSTRRSIRFFLIRTRLFFFCHLSVNNRIYNL